MTSSSEGPIESKVVRQTLVLRDYRYLDTKRLADYLATVMPDELEEIAQKFGGLTGKKTDDLASNAAGIGRINWGKGDSLEAEDVYESAIKIGAKQLFTQLHTKLRGHNSIELIQESEPTGHWDLKTRDMVEITRDFEPAVDDTIKRLSSFLQGLESSGISVGDEVKTLLRSVQGIESNVLPLVARPENRESPTEDASVVFLARSRLIIGGRTKEFRGNMAVCGKVQTRVKRGSLDLLGLLQIDKKELEGLSRRLEVHVRDLNSERTRDVAVPEPPGRLARLFWGASLAQQKEEEGRHREAQKRQAEETMTHWENIKWDSTVIPAPVLIITPLAVYA